MKPVVHGLEADYWGRLDFIYIDRENPDNREVVERYGITYQPYFILIAPDGTEIQRWFGWFDEAEFRAALDAYLASN
jgi:hypothetical protein